MKNILDQYPELRLRIINEDEYKQYIRRIDKCSVDAIGRAFAMSQRRSEQRRKAKPS